jgi:uncharacterized protein involved in outer membrane biogenesis
MTKRKKILLTGLASMAIFLIFTMAILPVIVRNQAVAAIEKETGRKISIQKVSINPFTLSVTVRGFSIAAKDGGKFVSVASVHASLGLASIYRRALILSEVSLDAPSITFSRLTANNYSFNDIIELQKTRPKSKSEAHFSINNISITNGSLDFNDQAVPGGRNHTIRDLKVSVPFISNIPYLVEKYTDPHISALVNGAPFGFDGKIKPLSKSMETSVHIDLKQLNLPEYIAYLPVKPPADLVSGKLTLDSEITYRIHTDKKPQLHIKGLVQLEQIDINLKNGKPLVRIPLFKANASMLEVLAQKFAFESITVEGLELYASRTAKGEWMYSQLLPAASDKKQPATDTDKTQEKSPPAQAPLVQVKEFAFNNGIVHMYDAQPAGGFKSEITQIDAAIRNFSTAADAQAEYEFSLLMDDEATFSADGSFSLTPLKATVSSELSGMKIQRAWPYMAQFLTAPVKGTIDFSSELAFNKADGLKIEQGSLLISELSTKYGDKEGFDLARFEINGAGFNQKENTAEIAEIRLSKGNISLSREADGSISVLSLLKQSTVKPATPIPQPSVPAAALATTALPAASPGKQATQDFSFRLKKFQLDSFNIAVTDKTVSDKPRFTLKNSSLSLTNLNGPKFTPATLKFTSTFNKGTPLKASGEITPLPFRYKGNVSIGRLPLRDFDAYFPSNLNVFILSGFADTSMTVDVSLKDGKPFGSFKGNAGVRAFHAIDTKAEEDLLKWESLQLDDIQGNLEPFSLALRQIALNGVYSRIIIRKDGTLNLQNLVEKPQQNDAAPVAPQTAAAGTPPTVVTPSAANQQTSVAQKQIRIDAVTIQDGMLSFTDNHLPQHFATTFYNLGGRVSGLSSEEAKFADVDLRGNLENHSPLQITGQINPLRGDLFVDLKVSFRDIELSPITPYTGRFLGYTVEKGKLFLDLKYRIDKKKLDSENKVFIDQFTFGEKVESDKATSLPVKLGLALLKDRRGEIHLDLPVTGRTDDPQFSIWGVVWQVVKNVLVKAVTSPFSLLSSMFGGGGQDFSAVQFDAGSSRLTAQEEQKLATLAKALLDRPALKVELKGYVDRERDTEGYRSDLFNRKLKNEKFIALSREGTLKEGEKADTVTVLPEEYARYLAAVYKKEKFPKPRNMFGLVKDLPPDEMKKLIITNTAVGDPELQTLARERILAVKNHLVLKGSVAPERVFEKNDNVFKAPEKETAPRSRVELNAIAQ